MRVRHTSDQPSKEGTYFFRLMDAAPWYIKPTMWNRFGPWAWVTRMMGLPLPGDEGGKYWPRGYKIQDVGPRFTRGSGGDFVKAEKEKVLKMRTRACPFGRVKAD